jgi:hypothetical protein
MSKAPTVRVVATEGTLRHFLCRECFKTWCDDQPGSPSCPDQAEHERRRKALWQLARQKAERNGGL